MRIMVTIPSMGLPYWLRVNLAITIVTKERPCRYSHYRDTSMMSSFTKVTMKRPCYHRLPLRYLVTHSNQELPLLWEKTVVIQYFCNNHRLPCCLGNHRSNLLPWQPWFPSDISMYCCICMQCRYLSSVYWWFVLFFLRLNSSLRPKVTITDWWTNCK